MNAAPVLFALALLATGCGRIGFGTDSTGAGSLDDITADPDLLGYWPLNEAAGATAFVDVSRFGNHGDCESCPTAGVAGVLGTAIDLGVSPAGIHVSAGPELAAWEGPLTVAAWVRLAVNDTYSVILSNDRDCCGTWDGFSLWGSRYEDGPGLVTWSDGVQSLAGGAELPLGTWAHVTGTFDGALNRVYVNGIEVASVPSAGFRAPFSFDTWIGAMGYLAPNYHLVGSLDEVMIIGRALSTDDVAALYASYPTP